MIEHIFRKPIKLKLLGRKIDEQWLEQYKRTCAIILIDRPTCEVKSNNRVILLLMEVM